MATAKPASSFRARWFEGELAHRILLSVGAFAAFPEILLGTKLYVPDDGFTSDIVNGELPMRVLFGKLLARGEFPLWTSEVGSGFPLAGGAQLEPIGASIFTLFPPITALCLFVSALVLLAAHGTYSLARQLGVSRAGATFAGIAFAGSGYMVSQLRHLTILGTVVWIPWAILLLEQACSAKPLETRARFQKLLLFAAIVAEQTLSGFPQSVHVSLLAYGTWFAAALVTLYREQQRPKLIAGLTLGFGTATLLGLGIGAIVLLPLREMGAEAGRDANFNSYWVHRFNYPPRLLANFFFPYVWGDPANNTYRGGSLFWEVHGYAGLLTPLLALVTLKQANTRTVLVLWLLVALSLLVAMGPQTPLFPLFWHGVPGLSSFRFWTRTLVVTDFALTLLAGLGLSMVLEQLAEKRPRKEALLVAALAIAGLVVDLFHHQRRQNPFVQAAPWLERPALAKALPTSGHVRMHSLGSIDFHQNTTRAHKGWLDSEPHLRRLAAAIPPNMSALWGVPAAGVYAGVAPHAYVVTYGDHSAPSAIPPLYHIGPHFVSTNSRYFELLALFGVTHVLSPLPIRGRIPSASTDGAHLFEIPGSRARYYTRAKKTSSDLETGRLLASLPLQTLWLAGETPLENSDVEGPATSTPLLVEELGTTHLRVPIQGLDRGYVYLADTFSPGWHAYLDGKELPIARGNLFGRAVALPGPGRFLEFRYENAAFEAGALVSAAFLGMLLFGLLLTRRREPEVLPSPDAASATDLSSAPDMTTCR